MRELIMKHQCPNCNSQYKLIKKCRLCGLYVCNLCSVDVMCIDCFIDKKQKLIIEEYDQKYEGVIKV